MWKRELPLVTVLFALGCGGSQTQGGVEPSCCAPPPPPPPADDEIPPAPADDAESSSGDAACAHISKHAASLAEFERGKQLVLACDEACRKSAAGGTKRAEGLALVKKAADKGHLEAQSFLGRTQFGDLMTTGAEPELKDAYIEALSYLALAAKRGSTDAKDFLPQLARLELSDEGGLSEELEEPLSSLEESWIRGALLFVSGELHCYSDSAL